MPDPLFCWLHPRCPSVHPALLRSAPRGAVLCFALRSYGLSDYGLRFTEDELQGLWRYLDRDDSGSIDYDEFLRGIRGDMNERRVAMVQLAWRVLDKTGDDRVTLADLEGTYDPSFHPDVRAVQRRCGAVHVPAPFSFLQHSIRPSCCGAWAVAGC